MWHTWQRTTCLWLSALVLLLIIIAFSTPGWLIYNINPTSTTMEATTYLGLWYTVYCSQLQGEVENCDSISYAKARTSIVSTTTGSAVFGGIYDDMVPFEVEATLGLIACVVGVLCIFIAFTYWCESWYCCSIRYYLVSAAIAFLLSGILVWIPTGNFARANDLLDNYEELKLGIPYSVILMAIAGILAFLLVILLAWMLCTDTHRYHSDKRRYSDSDYGDHNYSKDDDRQTRPYTIAEPHYEKPYRPSHRRHDYQESRYNNNRPHISGHSKRPPDYHQNWMYDNSLPRRGVSSHHSDYARRHDYSRGLDRSLRY